MSSKIIITIKRAITIISTMNSQNMMRVTINIIIKIITISRLMMIAKTPIIIQVVVVVLWPPLLDIKISIIITRRTIVKSNPINQDIVNNSPKNTKKSIIMGNNITSLIKMRKTEVFIKKSIKNLRIREIIMNKTTRSSKQGTGLCL
jgi:hypothetical protein